MTRTIATFTMLLLTCGVITQGQPDRPGPDAHEPEWSAYLAEKHGLIDGNEHPLPNGWRPDLIGKDVVWEVEWCKNSDSAASQAIRYAVVMDKKPGVWLLFEDGDDEELVTALMVLAYLRGYDVPIHYRITNVSK